MPAAVAADDSIVQGCFRLLVLSLLAALAAASPAAARTGAVELGAAINDGAFTWGDGPYRDTFTRNFDAATHEHSMKMIATQPERGRFDFSMADAIADWAVKNGKEVHGHTLIWCRDEWTPSWVTEREWTREELLTVMEDHIRTVVKRYSDRVATWDVVNEAITRTGGREPCVWQRYIGDDWIERAYRAAHEADPDAELFYNEYQAEIVNRKFAGMEAMAKDFLARGVPLDGIGLQHHTYGQPPLQDRMEEAMRRIAQLGLSIHVSEFNVPMGSITGTTEEKLALQAQAYQTVAATCQAQPACFRFTTWGHVDGIGWRPASEMALPFDVHYRSKPAWHAMQRVFRPSAEPAGNRAPSAPGTPSTGTAVARRDLHVSWQAATDADGHQPTYTLQHRDADDPDWTNVATGIRRTSFSFSSARLERQGTWHYRVRADDGYVEGPWSEASAPTTVDRTAPYAPTVAATRQADFTADVAWFRGSVTVGFTENGDKTLPDGSAGAGVDHSSVPAAVTFSATGAHAATGTVADLAGNVSVARSRSFSVDASPPTAAATATLDGAGYDGAWTRGDVDVGYACEDVGSGVASVPPAETVTTEGAGQRRSSECRDNVGNATTATSGEINIDRTTPQPPVATPDRAPEDAAGGWYRDAVTVSFSPAGDPFADGTAGSGVDPASVPSAQTFAAEGAHTAAASLRDLAGNTSAPGALTVRVDGTAPTLDVTCPETVELGAQAQATWTATDGGSGLATPTEGAVALDTATAGTRSVGMDAADRVGHAVGATCRYTVVEPAGDDQTVTDGGTTDGATTDGGTTSGATTDGTTTTEGTTVEGDGATIAGATASGATTDAPTTADAQPDTVEGTAAATTEEQAGASASVGRATVRLRTATARERRGGRLRLRLSCPADTTGGCHASVFLRHGAVRATASRTVRVDSGTTRAARLRLTRGMRGRLARRGILRLTLVIGGRAVRRTAPVRVLARP